MIRLIQKKYSDNSVKSTNKGLSKPLLVSFAFMLIMLNSASALVHPGGWLTQDQLTLIREKVAAQEEPWYSAWLAVKDEDAGTNYTASVSATITNSNAIQRQGHAAYMLAIKWVVTGDKAYATAGINVINDWANTVTAFDTDNSPLREGIGSNKMANAAEILAWGFNGEAGWSASEISVAQDWFQNVIYPITSTGPSRSMNWGTSCLAGNMSMAIFCDNTTMFDDAVDAYKFGFTNTDDGCAGVEQYIINAEGQCFESQRDQGHAQGGIAHLVEPALIAWNQGVDLVSYADDRIVAGMEYSAKYNLKYEVSWTNDIPNPCNVSFGWMDRGFISDEGQGVFSPIYVMASALFTRAGKAHPYTTEVITHEDYAQPEFYNDDHPGMGALCFVVTDEEVASPLIIEAEDYAAMSGVESTSTTDGEGGNKISSIDADDWMEYEITIPASGTYSLDYRISGVVDGDFKVELGDETIDDITFNATGGDETWETVSSGSSIYFTEGVSTIRVTSNVGGWNLNWIELLVECYDSSVTSNIETSDALGNVLSFQRTTKKAVFPGFTVSLRPADEIGSSWNWSGPDGFSSDVREVVLSDAQMDDSGNYVVTLTNDCGQETEETFVVNVTESLISEAEDFVEMSGVLTETTTDTGGGDNVHEINNEDWVEFEVDVPSTSSFYIDYRVASAITGGSFTVSSNGRGIDTVSFDATGGVQVWATATSSSLIALNTGVQTIRISSTMDEWSLNWFELKLDQTVGACELPLAQDDIVISNETFSWSSGVMAITCEESVSIFANISGTGTLNESDYLNIYYKLDDGALLPVSEKTGVFDDEFVYAEDLIGQVIEIVVEGHTSDANKTYVISDLLMQYGAVILSDDKFEAEDYDGIITGTNIKAEESLDEGEGMQMGFLSDGDWLMFRNVDLTNTPRVTARVSSNSESGTIEVRLGSATGTLIGTIPLETTSGWTTYASYSTDLVATTGLQDVYFVLSAGFNINWFQFSVDRTAIRDDEVRIVSDLEKVLGDEDYDPSAFVVSGLPVTYTSSNLEVAVIVDGKVSIIGVGTTIITAISEGSDLYYQAENTQTLTVTEVVLSLEGVESKVKVYPNPTSSYLMVSMERNQYDQLEIYNLTGTRVMNRNINDDEDSLHLDLERLSKGMYVMVFKGAQKVESHRVVKL